MCIEDTVVRKVSRESMQQQEKCTKIQLDKLFWSKWENNIYEKIQFLFVNLLSKTHHVLNFLKIPDLSQKNSNFMLKLFILVAQIIFEGDKNENSSSVVNDGLSSVQNRVCH